MWKLPYMKTEIDALLQKEMGANKYEEYTKEIFLIFEKAIDKIIEEYNRKTFLIIKEKFGAIKAAFKESIFDSEMDWEDHMRSIILMISSHYMNMLEIIRIEEFMKQMCLSRDEALAITCYLVDKRYIKLFMNISRNRNTLLAAQVINKCSTANQIRFEDSITVFCEYLYSNLAFIDSIARATHATEFTKKIDAILQTDTITHIL